MLEELRILVQNEQFDQVIARLLRTCDDLVDYGEQCKDERETLNAAVATLGPALAELFQPDGERPWSCVLLETLRRQPIKSIPILSALVLTLDKQISALKPLCGGEFQLLDSVRLRARTLALPNGKEPAIGRALQELLQGYRSLWHTEVWTTDGTPSTTLRPAGFRLLQQRDRKLGDLLDSIVMETPFGWHDPAATFLADALLESRGGGASVAADGATRSGQTWLLLSADDPQKWSTEPTGLVLRLTVERIADGCGAFYPHPEHAAHLTCTKSFQQSLRNAWQVVLGRPDVIAEIRKYDYRWSLQVVDDSHQVKLDKSDDGQLAAEGLWHRRRSLVCVAPLDGRSGEVALAAGLRSAVEQVPLDLSRAVTGCFAADQTTEDNPRINPVLDIPQKDIGIGAANEVLQRSLGLSRIQELLLPAEPAAGLPLGRPTLGVTDFFDAWRKLSEHSILTERYHRAVLKSTREWFRKNCFADEQPADDRAAIGTYILNSLKLGDRILDEEQAEQLVLGNVSAAFPDLAGGSPARLVKVVADSGIGKSSFLVYCQHRIAAVRSERIALRIEELTTFLAGQDRSHLLEAAVREVVHLLGAVDDDEAELRKAVRAWLDRKCSRGEVVWLLDALDQMSDHRGNLPLLAKEFPRCSVILTLRPDADLQHATVVGTGLADDAWTKLGLCPFDKELARRYLGRYADHFFNLLSTGNRADTNEQNVLAIPLLLHLLREYARGNEERLLSEDGTSTALRNRYAIYDKVVAGDGGLIDKGLQSLMLADRKTADVFGGSDQLAECLECMGQLAWLQVKQHHFDTTVRDLLYKHIVQPLKASYGRDAVSAIQQLNVVTRLPAFDDAKQGSFKWRHRSFLEYFAGCRLAELFADPATREEATAVLRGVQSVLDDTGNVRGDILNPDGETLRDLPADWHWTLRFALCHAATLGVHDALAAQLIRLGNPWIVYEALDRDRLKFDGDLERVCRWLVHRDYGNRDYRDAWQAEESAPVAAWAAVCRREFGPAGTASTAGWLEDQLLNRSTRDGAYLQPLCELLETTIAASDGNAALGDVASACRTALEQYLQESAARRRIARGILPVYESRFIPLPPGEFDPARYHNEGGLQQAGVTGPVWIPAGLRLSDFPVTNAELEEWCPTHRRWRNQYSHEDDQPAVYVSWYMGKEFAQWLTGRRTEGAYELPTEWVWESACRWGTETAYWWGDEMRDDVCWYTKTSHDSGTRSRRESEAAGLSHPSRAWALSQGLIESPGLLDAHGNVWEWNANRSARMFSARAVRGGSWYSSAAVCRSPYRNVNVPGHRDDYIGLRLCWRAYPISPESSSF